MGTIIVHSYEGLLERLNEVIYAKVLSSVLGTADGSSAGSYYC